MPFFRSSPRLSFLLRSGALATWLALVVACGPGGVGDGRTDAGVGDAPDAGFVHHDDGGSDAEDAGETLDGGGDPEDAGEPLDGGGDPEDAGTDGGRFEEDAGIDGGWDGGPSDDAGIDGGTQDAGPQWPFPETTLLSGPSGTVDEVEATFTFTANDPRHLFECSLDHADWTPCDSPITYTNLAEGTHWFEVRAVSPDGTEFDATPEQQGWLIELLPDAPAVVRVMAANITSGNMQSYTPGHGLRIFQGLKPDIVLIQEFNYGSNSAADLRHFVDTAFGPEFFFFRESGAQIPNGVISRYPILAHGVWDDPQVSNREFVWARIDVPGPVDLWAVSLHLLTASASVRNSEAIALVNYINTHVPQADLLVVGGDLNTDNRTEACITRLSQVVVTSNSQSPWPVDGNGNGGTNASRSKPYDWVLADPDLAPKEVPLVIGSRTFPNGLVFDSRVYTPLSEVAPILASDSGAPSMQHMAVMKAFLLP